MKNHKNSNSKFRFIHHGTVLYDPHYDEYYIKENGIVIMSQGKQLLQPKEYWRLYKRDKLFRMLKT